MDAHASGPQGWVLYDGGCGVCARWVPFWGPTLGRLGLAVAPLQEPWVAARVGVPPDALLTDIRLLFRDGRQLAGADVYRYVMRRLWWATPLYLLAAAPCLRQLFDGAYRAFADHRHRISRACGLGPEAHEASDSPVRGVVSLPYRRAFLTAEWRYLVMLNYEVDPRILEPLVPIGTVLDLWQGRALVSVVGFRFLRARLFGVAVPFHRSFDEVNLRFYVRRHLMEDEVRRGVVFVREFVPRSAVALLARLAYNEPYRVVPMRSTLPEATVEASGRIAYEWRTGESWERLGAVATGAGTVPAPESEAAFITGHYWGYTRQRDGGTVEYEVAHPAWRVWKAERPELSAEHLGLFGDPFARSLSGPPVSAFVADGSAVVVYPPRRLTCGVDRTGRT